MVYIRLFLLLLAITHESYCSNQPNIVFIIADDYGWNDIGYHGSEIATPNLDSLAAKGVKLENYYVQPICTPSRSQLLSGKWHLGFYKDDYIPVNRGFDSYIGYLSGSEDYYSRARGYEMFRGVDLTVNRQPTNSTAGIYSANLFSQRAEELIRSHDQTTPMFLYLAFQSVHSPLQVPAEYEQRYSHIQDHNRRVYAGMVSAMDEAIGNVTQSLVDSGMWNNTILVFTTDNGGQTLSGGNNAPLRGRKATYWEGGVRGVGFVSSPLLKRHGVVSHDMIHITDWYPTLVKLGGGSTSGVSLDGYNIWDTINHGVISPRKEILHNIDPMFDRKGESVSEVFDTSVQAALRYKDWKILTGDPGFDSWVPEPTLHNDYSVKFNDTREKSVGTQNVYLFNIAKDPNERFEVSNQNPEMVEFLLKRLAAYNQTAVPPFFPPDDKRCNPAKRGGFWGPWL